MPQQKQNFFQIGNKLLEGSRSYVKRKADDELFNSLSEGKFCYVFNASQMGKSSLLKKTKENLLSNNIQCVEIDLQGIGKTKNEKIWVEAIIGEIYKQLKLNNYLPDIDINDWLKNQLGTNFQRFQNFLSEVVLGNNTNKVLIFIDELDIIFNLPFRGNFLGCLRSLLGNELFYQKLTFCLLGVAKPQELIDDQHGSRWNVPAIGIELTGFKFEECSFYKEGFDQNKIEDSEEVIKQILLWTNGQPFLTQKVCYLLVNKQINISRGQEKQIITQFVQDEIINKGIEDEPAHLKTIKDRILVSDEEKRSKLLVLYKNILEENIPKNIDENLQQELRLAGLVIKQEGKLIVFNEIYKQVFNIDWINDEVNQLRSNWYKEKIEAWFKSNQNTQHRDRYYSLYGKELEEARKKYKQLSSEDDEFFSKSFSYYDNDKFGKIRETIGGEETWYKDIAEPEKEKIVDQLRYWTNYEKDIFDTIIEIINQYINNRNKLEPYKKDSHDEEKWVYNLIQTHIIENWTSIDILKKIDDAITNQKLSDDERFNLLVTYGEILQTGKVKFSEDNEEQKYLIQIGLVKRRYNLDDQGFTDLKVINPICETIFNLDYIHRNLPEAINGRSYGTKFGMWLITRENECLLNQEEFEEVKKLLSQVDDELEHEFILKSQLRNPLKIDSQ